MSTEVTIVGGGIGGLTLALMLHENGIAARVYEAAPELKAIGVGVNLLPHATRELSRLGLEDPLAAAAITTRESAFYNRFGQLIYSEPTGRHAGYEWPQFSIHRGDLHRVLLDAFRQRVGEERLHTGWRCTGFAQDRDGVDLFFEDPESGEKLETRRAAIAVSCEGIHSNIRRQLYPGEGPPRYSGINMWRGVTRAKPFLTGASMVRIGWLKPAKVLVYPIRDRVDLEGSQLINWVVDIQTPHYKPQRDWNRRGRLEDFTPAVADWHFDWLDVPALLECADMVLEYPMVDQDPLPRWTFDRITLLGDAAHPMVPRGANGAAQAILDCRALADCLKKNSDPAAALAEYERRRLPATTKVVLTNRQDPPDAILREVFLRTGDRPFRAIDEVISREELAGMSERYHRISGSDRESVQGAR